MNEEEYREQMRNAGAHATQGCGFLGIGCLAVLAFPAILVLIGVFGALFGGY